MTSEHKDRFWLWETIGVVKILNKKNNEKLDELINFKKIYKYEYRLQGFNFWYL